MSWFSFLNKNTKEDTVPVTDAAPVTPQPKSKAVKWLETSSDEIYEETLENMYLEVEAIGGFKEKSHQNNARIYAQVLLKKLRKLDRSRLSAEQKRVIAAIVFVRFPQAVAKMETQLTDLSLRSTASEHFGEYMRLLMTKYIDDMPRKIPVPNQLTAEPEKGSLKPVGTVGSAESDEKLASVKTLAAEAYKLATSIEDRFFAEQSANSYIPDSVRMLAGLTNAPEDMKKEAHELFMRQLEIIESQLNAIVRRSASDSLSELKAHTEFLESKNEASQNQLNVE